jgi:hypothetical protein
MMKKTIVHDIEQDINAKIMDFQKTYPNRDKLDCVIMTLLTYTFDLKKQLPVNSQEEIDLPKQKKSFRHFLNWRLTEMLTASKKKRYKMRSFFLSS